MLLAGLFELERDLHGGTSENLRRMLEVVTPQSRHGVPIHFSTRRVSCGVRQLFRVAVPASLS